MVFVLFAVLTIAWWGVLWFVLPVDLAALAPPSLISLHVAPPVLALFALLVGNQAWKWNVARKKKIRKDAKEAQEAADLAAKAAASEAELAQRRAVIDCRAVWLAVPETPDWFMNESPQCRILEQDADSLRAMGRDAALSSSLQLVFEAALLQCEALAYLPLYLLPGHAEGDEMALERVREAWQEALAAVSPEDAPAPDCRLIPASDEPLTDRIITLFENDPAMPAMCLFGADSLLDKAAAGIKPGHAVAALILSRPSLTLTETDIIEKPDLSNPYLPHWEREQGYKDAPQWGKVPPRLRKNLWSLSPVAALHRSRALNFQGEAVRPAKGRQQFHALIENVLVDAALREPDGKAKETEPPELEFLFHNCGADNAPATNDKLTPVFAALRRFDYWMKSDRAKNVLTEQGDTGTACPALMLAEATMCAAMTQMPVMVVDSGGADRLSIGVVRPAAGT
ncbi:MAG: hypothetical protein FWG26_10465 [Betaproteobacteria bacterium]|nr:hypothetical protein [Betaproteobacteria bacterium]